MVGADFSEATFTKKITAEDFHNCRMGATTRPPKGYRRDKNIFLPA